MSKPALQPSSIVMNHSTPPGTDDLIALATEILEFIPSEFKKYIGDFSLEIEDFPDLDVEEELDLESPYDQLAYYKSFDLPRNNMGVSAVGKGDADILVLYRRPILDLWCETEQDLEDLIREVIFQEIGGHCGYSDEEVEEILEQL